MSSTLERLLEAHYPVSTALLDRLSFVELNCLSQSSKSLRALTLSKSSRCRPGFSSYLHRYDGAMNFAVDLYGLRLTSALGEIGMMLNSSVGVLKIWKNLEEYKQAKIGHLLTIFRVRETLRILCLDYTSITGLEVIELVTGLPLGGGETKAELKALESLSVRHCRRVDLRALSNIRLHPAMDGWRLKRVHIWGSRDVQQLVYSSSPEQTVQQQAWRHRIADYIRQLALIQLKRCTSCNSNQLLRVCPLCLSRRMCELCQQYYCRDCCPWDTPVDEESSDITTEANRGVTSRDEFSGLRLLCDYTRADSRHHAAYFRLWHSSHVYHRSCYAQIIDKFIHCSFCPRVRCHWMVDEGLVPMQHIPSPCSICNRQTCRTCSQEKMHYCHLCKMNACIDHLTRCASTDCKKATCRICETINPVGVQDTWDEGGMCKDCKYLDFESFYRGKQRG